jgi:cytochrome c peroxidase
VKYARPLWYQLYLFQKEKAIPFLKEMGLVNTTSPHLFDSSFFNAASFSGVTETADQTLVSLGRQLFLDKRLSENETRSCASCHQPQNGYADNLPKSSSIDGRSVIFRNTPTILYAALQPVQFADSRISFLEDQAKAVIENHSEMKGDLKKIAAQLTADTMYQRHVVKAFGKSTLTGEHITKALAAFIHSQAPFSSPFDAYLRGHQNEMSAEAIKGFNLFMGKAKCGTCHFMPLFNGVVPPHFMKMESEVIGVPKQAKAPFLLDADEGKYRFTGAAVHRFAFKTPTLRNIALTAPYMHNGVYQTLEEVLDFYDKGGAAGLDISLPNQTLPAEPLHLTKDEKRAIVQFLHSLTDR